MATDIIPDDQPSIFEVINSLSQLDQQAIVRPNNPPPGIAGFLFDIPEDDDVTLRSDITDHWLEDNTTVQDNFALKPEEYTVRGLVAEIVAIQPTQQAQAKVANTLPLNPQYLPTLTPGAQQQADANDLALAETSAQASATGSLYGFFNQNAGQPPNQTKQAKIFNYFEQLWLGRQLCTVETPWGTFVNMGILMMRANQDDETKFRSTFTVTFKKFRFAGQASVSVGQLAGRALQQSAPVTQNGNAAKTPVSADNQSILYQMFGQ